MYINDLIKHISSKCDLCGEDNVYDPRQYFMVHDSLWKEFLEKSLLDTKNIVCFDCFEKVIGREIEQKDLVFAPINLIFIASRWPDEARKFINCCNSDLDLFFGNYE